MKAKETCVTRFSPGDAWVTGRPFEEQPGYRRQVRWWMMMRRRGLLSWIGIPVGHPQQILVRWHGISLSEARRQAANAPFVRRGVLREATPVAI
jgi:hypothetical protein